MAPSADSSNDDAAFVSSISPVIGVMIVMSLKYPSSGDTTLVTWRPGIGLLYMRFIGCVWTSCGENSCLMLIGPSGSGDVMMGGGVIGEDSGRYAVCIGPGDGACLLPWLPDVMAGEDDGDDVTGFNTVGLSSRLFGLETLGLNSHGRTIDELLSEPSVKEN